MPRYYVTYLRPLLGVVHRATVAYTVSSMSQHHHLIVVYRATDSLSRIKSYHNTVSKIIELLLGKFFPMKTEKELRYDLDICP